MYKVNLLLIVLSCLAVFCGATYLAIGPKTAESASPTVEDLVRQLGDSDPDVRREAEASLIESGEAAIPALERASKSKRRILASRARRLLGKMGITPSLVENPEKALSKESPSVLAESPSGVALELSPPVNGQVYVRLVNHQSIPVLVARELSAGLVVCGVFGWFEFEDGRRSLSHTDVANIEWVVVNPGESIELFVGIPTGPGTPVRARFVYDASEKSEYRNLVHPTDLGAPLPPDRIVSSWVELNSPEN